MLPDDLIPLKQIIGALGVSRPTLWRACKAVANFPTPLIVQRRVFRREDDVAALKDALKRYTGRVKFETDQKWA